MGVSDDRKKEGDDGTHWLQMKYVLYPFVFTRVRKTDTHASVSKFNH